VSRLALVPVVVLLVSVALAAPAVAGAAPPTLFPTDALTVADGAQATGLRLNLPLPDCAARPSDCSEIRLLNELDGFDVDPRIEIGLGRTDDVARVTPDTVYVRPVAGGERIGLNRLVVSPARGALFGQPARQLAPATTYELVVTPALTGEGARTTFTTMSPTASLDALRRQLDDGTAYTAAGIAPGDRGLKVERSFDAPNVLELNRLNDTGAPERMREAVVISSRAAAGKYVFGSFLAPQWLDAADRTIEQRPTGGAGPPARRAERVGFALILPAGPKPAGGYPVAVFGPGITRSKYDVFLAADENAARGIATIAVDPVGHAFGPRGELEVRTALPPATVTLPQFGRAADVDGDGAVDNREGVQAPSQPHPRASIGLRDGLRQTALDQMTLVRAIGAGVDLDGDASVDLRPERVTYYAQSLGGIYGTQFVATDPLVDVAALNVPGGPILEIARLSPGFRSSVSAELGGRVPSLLNGGCEGFTESFPLVIDPPVTAPAIGAVAIQEAGARVNWLNRSGSPEAYAPAAARERVFYQFAFGDRTVPNPTSATLVRAGGLLDRTTIYRNDRTPTAGSDPHGFLLDPRIAGHNLGQRQVTEFLATEGRSLIDPDGGGNVFEVPIADPLTLERPNYPYPCLGTDAPPAERAPAAPAGGGPGGTAGPGAGGAPAAPGGGAGTAGRPGGPGAGGGGAGTGPGSGAGARGDGLVRLVVTPRRIRAGRTVRLRLRTVVLVGARVRPLPGVTVRVAGRRVRTGRTGRATIRLRIRRPGPLRVIGSLRGLRADRDLVTVLRARRR